ncbi:hypothetical protein Q9L58_001374 [Maublancomyces gigas]|uniref:Mitochondrial inner membrane translocase subunit Tim17/Tim22/Tim23/peroxisomal protein PMP24 n=1 Tax=Discina gigas TaxID=1032678 RepID=A0ABR3GUN3_9PEZI
MQPQTDPPDSVLNPALKFGAVTGPSLHSLGGAAGVVLGGVNAILRGSPNMGLYSVLTGFNCALLGSSYWASRATILRAMQNTETSLREKTYVSGASGALSGSLVALATGKPRSILPGALVWGLVGLVGQSAYNVADAHHTQHVAQEAERERSGGSGFWDRAMRSKWSPVTRLTTEEYKNMLKEKLLVLEADLALANEEIERLERIRREQKVDGKEP